MCLNASKCKIVHFGKSTVEHSEYTMDDLVTNSRMELEVSRCERDLGVNISSDLKWKKHVELIANKANRVLGMLKRTFTSRDVDLWKMLYVSLVRPHLEFAAPVWNSNAKGDIKMLEKVQERASKIPFDLRNLPYEERLRAWGLTTLEERRTRGDLIQIYKALNGIENFNWFTGPQFSPRTQTRSSENNDFRLERESFPAKNQNDFGHFVSVRHDFFLNRVTERWNRLSNSQVHAPSVNSFKAQIDSLPEIAAIAK